jgi:hypothetical protein
MNARRSSFSLTASTEDHHESPPNGGYAGETDDIELADNLAMVTSLSKEIQNEQAKVASAEAVILTLESHKGTLSPFDVQMLNLTAARIGVRLGHQSMGYGVEAYQGPRGRALLSISTENFREFMAKAIERIMELFERLKRFLRAYFIGNTATAEGLIARLKNHATTAKMVDADTYYQIGHTVSALCLTGRFNPKQIIVNTQRVLTSLTDAQYLSKVTGYGDEALRVIEPLAKDGANWRRHVEGVNKLDVPRPETFTVEETSAKFEKYRSLPMVRGVSIMYSAVPQGNNHGARGARERSVALSETGSVVQYQDGGNHDLDGIKALRTYGQKGIANDIPAVIEVLEASIAASRAAKTLLTSADHDALKIRNSLRVAGADADDAASSICVHLASSVVSVTNLASTLLSRAAAQAVALGRIYTHLIGIKLV